MDYKTITDIFPVFGGPGTTVSIFGKHLAKDQDDITRVIVCDIDCTSSAYLVGSSKISCSLPRESYVSESVGSVIVHTKSYGCIQGNVQFRYKANRLNVNNESDVWLDENMDVLLPVDSNDKRSTRKIEPDPLQIIPVGEEEDLDYSWINSSKVDLSNQAMQGSVSLFDEDFNSSKFLLVRHQKTTWDQFKVGINKLRTSLSEYNNKHDQHSWLSNSSNILFDMMRGLHALTQKSASFDCLRDPRSTVDGASTFGHQTFDAVLYHYDSLTHNRDYKELIKKYKLLFSISETFQHAMKTNSYDGAIEDYHNLLDELKDSENKENILSYFQPMINNLKRHIWEQLTSYRFTVEGIGKSGELNIDENILLITHLNSLDNTKDYLEEYMNNLFESVSRLFQFVESVNFGHDLVKNFLYQFSRFVKSVTQLCAKAIKAGLPDKISGQLDLILSKMDEFFKILNNMMFEKVFNVGDVALAPIFTLKSFELESIGNSFCSLGETILQVEHYLHEYSSSKKQTRQKVLRIKEYYYERLCNVYHTYTKVLKENTLSLIKNGFEKETWTLEQHIKIQIQNPFHSTSVTYDAESTASSFHEHSHSSFLRIFYSILLKYLENLSSFVKPVVSVMKESDLNILVRQDDSLYDMFSYFVSILMDTYEQALVQRKQPKLYKSSKLDYLFLIIYCNIYACRNIVIRKIFGILQDESKTCSNLRVLVVDNNTMTQLTEMLNMNVENVLQKFVKYKFKPLIIPIITDFGNFNEEFSDIGVDIYIVNILMALVVFRKEITEFKKYVYQNILRALSDSIIEIVHSKIAKETLTLTAASKYLVNLQALEFIFLENMNSGSLKKIEKVKDILKGQVGEILDISKYLDEFKVSFQPMLEALAC